MDYARWSVLWISQHFVLGRIYPLAGLAVDYVASPLWITLAGLAVDFPALRARAHISAADAAMD